MFFLFFLKAKSNLPRREQTGSVSSEGDVDVDLDGIELEAIPESPIRIRPDSDWGSNQGGSIADLEVILYWMAQRQSSIRDSRYRLRHERHEVMEKCYD